MNKISGLCGAIQFRIGYVSSIALLGICLLSSIWGRYEDGYLSKHKKEWSRMRVAKKVKENYSGELLTDKQWKKRGYQPKKGELPEQMWANQECCGSGKPEKFSYPYFFDYQMEKEKK